MYFVFAWMAELADALDSKSSSFTRLRVRPPLQVPVNGKIFIGYVPGYLCINFFNEVC